MARLHPIVAVVARANKLVRIARAVLRRDEKSDAWGLHGAA